MAALRMKIKGRYSIRREGISCDMALEDARPPADGITDIVSGFNTRNTLASFYFGRSAYDIAARLPRVPASLTLRTNT